MWRRLSFGPLAAAGLCAALLPALASVGPTTPLASGPAAVPPAASDTIPNGLASELTGKVISQDGGEAVPQAELRLRRVLGDSVIGSSTHVTGQDGTFHIQRVPAGIYVLRTDHLSYASRRDSLRIPGKKSIHLRIPLPVDPVALRPLAVDVRAGWLVETGFYRRKEKGFGDYLSPEDLERRPLNDLSQALGTVQGVRFVRSCAGVTCREVMVTRNTRAGCPVKYYLDGDEMHGRVHPRNISMHDIAAIEVYAGIASTPPQFYGRCGSVVMWSKRR